MAAQVIDGKAVAARVRRDLAEAVPGITRALGRPPGLAVVLVGDNPASQVYVRSKSKAAKECGLDVIDAKLPASASQREVEDQLAQLSENERVDGILLQLPLPKGLDELRALLAIRPDKDADGLHPLNQGLLLRGAAAPKPCTPAGCIVLVDEALRSLGRPSDLSGMHAVVAGRSILVGKPMAQLLLDRNCTVTICHSRTADLAAECARADILVAAVGRAKIIGAEHVKPGAVVIDVGINQDASGKLVGDVDFAAVSERAAAVTPVPGGVGPMTIAMLLANTVEAARNRLR